MVCTLLSIASTGHWKVHQMDVHNVFLNKDLTDEIYVSVLGISCYISPPGVSVEKAPLKSSASASMLIFKPISTPCKCGFLQSYANYAFLLIIIKALSYVYSFMWMICKCRWLQSSYSIKYSTSVSYFHMKDLNHLKYSLGIEIAQNPTGLYLCQEKNTLQIISETGLSGAKLVPVVLLIPTILCWAFKTFESNLREGEENWQIFSYIPTNVILLSLS